MRKVIFDLILSNADCDSKESRMNRCDCRFRVNPSPCQGHVGEIFNCFIALTVADPERIFAAVVLDLIF